MNQNIKATLELLEGLAKKPHYKAKNTLEFQQLLKQKQHKKNKNSYLKINFADTTYIFN